MTVFNLPEQVILNIKFAWADGVPVQQIINDNVPAQARQKIVDFLNYYQGEGTAE